MKKIEKPWQVAAILGGGIVIIIGFSVWAYFLLAQPSKTATVEKNTQPTQKVDTTTQESKKLDTLKTDLDNTGNDLDTTDMDNSQKDLESIDLSGV